jgi:hypothetical protein
MKAMRGVEMSAIVLGTLYVHCSDELCLSVGSQLDVLVTPGVWRSEFSSEGETIFALSEVPYPVEQARYTLANLYQESAKLGRPVYWSWVPPAGSVVLPGGSLGMTCREGPESRRVKAELQSWFPGSFLYTFSAGEGWVLYQVDTPPPGKDFYDWYVAFKYGPSAREFASVSFYWLPWFDRVVMPDGSFVVVAHPEL